MENFKPILRILFPSIICFVIIYITNMSIDYYPLSFGLVIGFTNLGLHKYKALLGILLSVIVSYASFFIAYFSFAITGNIFNFIVSGDLGNILGLNVSTNIIAPLLVFLLYRIVFNIPKTKLTIIVVLSSVVFLVLQSCFFYYMNSTQIDSFMGKILNLYTIWQVIMALALQIIINQKIVEPKNK